MAKCGAKHTNGSCKIDLLLSLQEDYSLLQNACWKHFRKKWQDSDHFSPMHDSQILTCENSLISSKLRDVYNYRSTISLFYRFKLNAFKTKFSKNINCICGQNLTNTHILFQCKDLKQFLPSFSCNSLDEILADSSLMLDIVLALTNCPIIRYL